MERKKCHKMELKKSTKFMIIQINSMIGISEWRGKGPSVVSQERPPMNSFPGTRSVSAIVF
jgi:hypothetical protein